MAGEIIMNEKINAFNKVADVYDDWYRHPQGRQIFNAERDAVDSMIPPEGVGIEIGSGTGAFTESLEDHRRVIVGLDPSVEMLSRAVEKNTHNVLGYGDHAPFRPIFDFSYMITVIEFLDNPVETLTEIKKICKDDASFTLLFINDRSPWGTFYREIGSKGDPVFKHARLYELDEITKLFLNAGYKIISSKGTLSSEPMTPNVDRELVSPNDNAGVIVVKAVPRVSRLS